MSDSYCQANLTVLAREFSIRIDRFDAAWQSEPAPAIDDFLDSAIDDTQSRRSLLLELVQIDLEHRWKCASTKGYHSRQTIPTGPLLEDYVSAHAELTSLEDIPLTVVLQEYRVRRKWGDRPSHEEYSKRFPHFQSGLADSLGSIDLESVSQNQISTGLRAKELSGSTQVSNTLDPHSKFARQPPERVGRYKLVKLLGTGGFADVYLANDEQLGRSVAVKIPHYIKGRNAHSVESYLTEARTAANLDHPHIVPVYDVGADHDCGVYVVSKYIQGINLAERLRSEKLSLKETAELISKVAGALHHAHLSGLVHCDVKPANILLDANGTPYLTDFGLAVEEDEQRRRAGEVAGTFPYMAPEQVRGEVHRFDGRVDVWALGVILYEMLAGRRPFRGETLGELDDEIVSREAKPLRQVDDSIPRELERITLKCLSKQITDRYATCRDLVDDLNSWLRLYSQTPLNGFDVDQIDKASNARAGCSETVARRSEQAVAEETSTRVASLLRSSWSFRLVSVLFAGVAPNLFLSVILLLFFNVVLQYELDSRVPMFVNLFCYGTAIIVGFAVGWRVVFRVKASLLENQKRLIAQAINLPVWISSISFLLWFVGAGMVFKFGTGDQPVNTYAAFVGANFVAGSLAASLVFFLLCSVSLYVVSPRQLLDAESTRLVLLSRLAHVFQYTLSISPVVVALVMFLGYEKSEQSTLLRYVVVASIMFIVVCFLTVIVLVPKIRERISVCLSHVSESSNRQNSKSC